MTARNSINFNHFTSGCAMALGVMYFLALGVPALAEGVTLIMHGWNVASGEPSWTGAMQNAIRDARLSGDENFGTITVTGSKGALTATCNPWNTLLPSSSTGEIVIRVDWSAVANHLTSGVSAQEVAAVIAPKIYQAQGTSRPLCELPIHLIGHSRGGGMVCEIARLLGLQGIDVDQVTPLDPHPLTASDPQPIFPLPAVIDTPVAVYENVLFIDNYWQNISYPQGQSIAGAYNRQWTSLAGGYHNHSNSVYSSIGDHLNIYLQYMGTVDLATPINDGEATLGSTERAAWFNTYETDSGTAGQKTGFYYSRIGGRANRLSADTPVSGGDQVKDGYNNNVLLGGDGARSSLSWTSAVWPNVLTLDVLRGSAVLGPGTVGVSIGETLDLRYTYRDYDSASDVTFYVDQDRNPYNGNNLATITTKSHAATGSSIAQSIASWNTTGLSPSGMFYVYAKITDGPRTRYMYAAPSFQDITTRVQEWNVY